MNRYATMPDDLLRLLPLVLSIANRLYQATRHYVPSLDIEDLVQEGMIGLLRAKARFDPTVGCQFVTFAYSRIRGAMLDLVREEQDECKSRQRYVLATRALQQQDHGIDDGLDHTYLPSSLPQLTAIQQLALQGMAHEVSDHEMSTRVGLTYWQYRRLRLKTVAKLRDHLSACSTAEVGA